MSVKPDPFSPEVLRERVAKWVASPEGKKALADTAKAVADARRQLAEAFRVDPELLRKPMTI